MEEKEDGINCPICFGEYTSTGDHRIASMKCGHLFGHSCILEWYGKRKHVLCPVCATKCLKSQIRLIFSSKVVALNTEKEHKLIEQYLNEFNSKNKLLEEISALKTELEVLKLNKLTNCECKHKTEEVAHTLSLYKKFLINLFGSKTNNIIIDDVHNFVIVSAVKDGKPCIVKNYPSGMMGTKIFNENGIISHMKYIDGNIVLSINEKFFIVNTYNFNIIFEDSNINRITSLSVKPTNRNRLIIGDNKGNITFYTLGINKRSLNLCNIPIHSIYEYNNIIYIGTVYNIYKLKINKNWDDFLESEELPEIRFLNLEVENMSCINIFGEDDSVVLVFRNKQNKIMHYFLNDTYEKAINLGFTQITKFYEILYDKRLYLVDQINKKIIIYNDKYEKDIEYKTDENIISFDVRSNSMMILSEKFIYMYK